MGRDETTRRRFLGSSGTIAVALVAGCLEGQGDVPAPTDETAGTATETGTAEGTTGTTAATTTALDLREANVTAVEIEGGDGSYRFDVTIFHDDVHETKLS